MTPKAYFLAQKYLMLHLHTEEAQVVQRLDNNNDVRGWLVKAGINPLLFLLEELYDS